MFLIVITGGLESFEIADQLISYLGLVPTEKRSNIDFLSTESWDGA